nr:hypothetical protein [Tanacetum cinerariifolium]
MTWHHEYRRDPGVLSHPSDGEAWKYFDRTHPSFTAEPRNVRLGLCADEYTWEAFLSILYGEKQGFYFETWQEDIFFTVIVNFCQGIIPLEETKMVLSRDELRGMNLHLGYRVRKYEVKFSNTQRLSYNGSKRLRRNDDGDNVNEREDVLSIFKHPVRPSGNSKRRYLNDNEYETAIFYVLQNCEEIQPFFRIFEGEVKLEMPNITNSQLVDVTKKRSII